MSDFFKEYLGRTEPESEFCVEITSTLRAWFRIDKDYGAKSVREAGARAKFTSMTTYTDGKFKGYKGFHPTWYQPTEPVALLMALNLASMTDRGEKLVEDEWVPAPLGEADWLELSRRAAIFDAVIDRVSVQSAAHAQRGEADALEAAKKKSTGTPDTLITSESGSE
jgi:hypothetical protein